MVINANSGEIAKTYYGIGFTWDKNMTHVYYTSPQPFFSDVRGNDKIYEDDTVIYESNKNMEIFGGPALNEEGNKIVFFEKEVNSNDFNLVVGEKKTNEKIESVKKIKWNNGSGKITFNKDNTINIDKVYSKVKFDLDSEKIIDNK